MSRFPNLDACKLLFMHFYTHLPKGMAATDAFWEQRGLSPAKQRLMVLGYSRQRIPHTVFLELRQSHETCCDLRFGVELGSPARTFRKYINKYEKMLQKDFLDFLEHVREQDKYLGITARYGLRAPSFLPPSLPGSSRVSLTSLAFNVDDEKGETIMKADLMKAEGEWVAVIEPSDRRRFDDRPISAALFDRPYKLACALSQSVGRNLT